MSKFVELFKSKPFIFTIALVAVAIVAISALFIFPNAQSKNPATDIQCICETEEFRSGKDAEGAYQVYNMTFTTPQGFKSPIVEFSYNIEAIIQKAAVVEITFTITQGVNFWFNISSQNYESKKFHFTAVPYIKTLDMNIDLVDENNFHYSLSNEGSFKLLYLTTSTNYKQAIRDRLPSQIEFSISSNANKFEDRYLITTSNNSVLQIENNTITPIGLGTCTVTLSSTDGSGFVTNVRFKVCKIPVLSISNLPSSITINVQEKFTYQLKDFNVYPSYADLSFFDFENDTIKCQNMLITAKKLGNTELVFANQSNVIQHRMQISVVSQTPSPDDDNDDDTPNNQNSAFAISLAKNSNENIVFDNSTKTFTLSLSDFDNNRGILKILISLENVQSATTNFDADYEVEDENNIILEHKLLLGNVGISLVLNAPGTVILAIQNTELGIPPLDITIVVNP